MLSVVVASNCCVWKHIFVNPDSGETTDPVETLIIILWLSGRWSWPHNAQQMAILKVLITRREAFFLECLCTYKLGYPVTRAPPFYCFFFEVSCLFLSFCTFFYINEKWLVCFSSCGCDKILQLKQIRGERICFNPQSWITATHRSWSHDFHPQEKRAINPCCLLLISPSLLLHGPRYAS